MSLDFKKIVGQYIESVEDLGEKAGGSGHLGFKSFGLDEISEPEKVPEGWKVSFKYTIYIESEFAYDPDNPPPSYPHTGTITVDNDGKELTTS